MPTIVIATSKGGGGKTTAAILLTSELARQGMEKDITISLIDADPNQHSARWARKEGCPKNIKLYSNSTEETILDDIEKAEKESGFVIVDLEGTASMAVASAICRADYVLIPVQGSHDDGYEAVKTIKLIKNQSRVLGREIPYSVFFTRTNAAITPRTLTSIVNDLRENNIPMLDCSLIDREAFRAIRSFGGSIHELDPKEVSGIEKAFENAKTFTEEVKRNLLKILQGRYR